MNQDLNKYVDVFKKQNLFVETNLNDEDLTKVVNYITYDSKDMREQSIFVCKGAHFSPKYLKEASENGAICYLSEVSYDDVDIPYILVNDVRKAMPYLADFFYNKVWKDITTIGITGTKGKSTTANYMKYILDEYAEAMHKPKTAIVSGIDNYDGVINEESHLTTPEAMMLHRHFYNAVKSGIEFLTMEVSSQALKYDRTLGITFDVGCFLNIGEDHISDIEHSDFEDYFNSKLVLFEQCKIACIHSDTEGAEEVIKAATGNAERIITFGLKENADIYGYDVVKTDKYISFKVKSDSFNEEIKLSMAGLFNVQNALAAIAISYGLNIPLNYVKAGLKKAKVSGRMEVYSRDGSDMKVIVDYAHNKMSFETLFKSTQKEYPDKKITIVFGCPGKKALSRRKELGELAGKYAHMVYITEEDAGEESVQTISEEIASHVAKQNCPCEIIVDREEAITKAIKNGDEDTIILITGKGRETRQKRGIKYIDCASDVEIVLRLLGKN